MTNGARHALNATPRDRAKTVILQELGLRKVAEWCNVSESAVYQWLSRGTDSRPIPTERALAIISAAQAEGITFNASALCPSATLFVGSGGA
jgi:transposase